MSAIPLYELDEVATKRDLAELRADLLAEFHSQTASLREEMNSRFLQLTFVLVAGLFGIIATLIGITILT